MYIAHFFNDYLFWFDERLKMTQTIADTHAFWWMIHETNANVIKLYKNEGNFNILGPLVHLFIRPIILIFNLKTQNQGQ